MKPERLLYSGVGALFLLMMVIGFRAYIFHGQADGGRTIAPEMHTLVAFHGGAIALWFVLFFAQAALITVRQRKLHMTLGWGVAAVGLAIMVTGTLVAVQSVRHSPPEVVLFGMPYARFLLVMLAEITGFTAFLVTGVLTRKSPRIHRNAMLLASLCLLSGASARMHFLDPLFGGVGWWGLFGPVFLIGAAMVALSSWRMRSLDRWFAGAYAAWVVVFVLAAKLALTQTWDSMASVLLR